MPPVKTILPFLNKHSAILLPIALISLTTTSIAQRRISGGMETPSGFLQISVDELTNKRNLAVSARDITSVLPRETDMQA